MKSSIICAIDKSQNEQRIVRVNANFLSIELFKECCNSIDPNCEIHNMEFGRFEVRGVLVESYSIRVRLNGLGSPGQ